MYELITCLEKIRKLIGFFLFGEGALGEGFKSMDNNKQHLGEPYFSCTCGTLCFLGKQAMNPKPSEENGEEIAL